MGKHHKVTDGELAIAVADSVSWFGVLRKLNIRLTGGSNTHYKVRAAKLGLDSSHFTGAAHNRGKVSSQRKTASDFLVLRTDGVRQNAAKLVRSLLEVGREHKCAKCGQGPEWYGNPLTLDVDHINENWLDDRAENLRFLCPNCHSQFSRRLLGK